MISPSLVIFLPVFSLHFTLLFAFKVFREYVVMIFVDFSCLILRSPAGVNFTDESLELKRLCFVSQGWF